MNKDTTTTPAHLQVVRLRPLAERREEVLKVARTVTPEIKRVIDDMYACWPGTGNVLDKLTAYFSDIVPSFNGAAPLLHDCIRQAALNIMAMDGPPTTKEHFRSFIRGLIAHAPIAGQYQIWAPGPKAENACRDLPPDAPPPVDMDVETWEPLDEPIERWAARQGGRQIRVYREPYLSVEANAIRMMLAAKILGIREAAVVGSLTQLISESRPA